MTSRRYSNHINTDPFKYLLFAGFMIFALSLCYKIFCAGSYAVKNEELELLISKKSELETEIALLDYRCTQYDNIRSLEIRAKELGLVKSEDSVIAVEINSGRQVAAARP